MPQFAARDGEILKNCDILRLDLPCTAEAIRRLVPGTLVALYGTVYTARDQAHKRIAEAIRNGEKLPIDLDGAAIYYCGPTPGLGKPIGACGPTTSGRMDAYAPLLMEHGVNVMIGKGARSEEVTAAIKKSGAVYLTAIGGAAALYQSRVTACELVAYPDLGCEAIYKLTVQNFPAAVGIV